MKTLLTLSLLTLCACAAQEASKPAGQLEQHAWLEQLVAEWIKTYDLIVRIAPSEAAQHKRVAQRARSQRLRPRDLIRLAVFTSVGAIVDGDLEYEEEYRGGVRVAGVKFMLDGSPQGRTAWVTEPYHEGPPGAPADYRAYGIMLPDVYKSQAAGLIEQGIPFLAHGNGDAAMDLMIEGVSEAVAGMDPMPDHRSIPGSAENAFGNASPPLEK